MAAPSLFAALAILTETAAGLALPGRPVLTGRIRTPSPRCSAAESEPLLRLALPPAASRDVAAEALAAASIINRRLSLDAPSEEAPTTLLAVTVCQSDGGTLELVGAEVDQSEAPKPIEAFTKSLSTIEEFVKHLANAGLHNVSIECHDATLKFESGSVDGSKQQGVVGCHLQIVPKTVCCYLVQPCPPGVADGFPNLGSKLLADESMAKWNFETRQNHCGHLVVHDQVQYRKEI